MSLRLCGLILWVVLSACSHSIQLDSRFRDRELVIDGADADWGPRRYILEDAPLSMGVLNDEEHLYLLMITADRSLQMQVATRGLELWLDPAGGRKQVFGLRLPGAMRLGRHGEEPDGMSLWDEGDSGDPIAGREPGLRGRGAGGTTTDAVNPRRLEAMFERLRGTKIFVLDSPGDQGWETTAGVADVIQIALAYDAGRLIYEARLPLTYLGTPHYEIDLTSQSRIGVALKVPTMRDMMTPSGRPREGGLRGTGGPGGRSGGPGGGGFGMSGGRAQALGEVFEQWAKIRLAAPR